MLKNFGIGFFPGDDIACQDYVELVTALRAQRRWSEFFRARYGRAAELARRGQ